MNSVARALRTVCFVWRTMSEVDPSPLCLCFPCSDDGNQTESRRHGENHKFKFLFVVASIGMRQSERSMAWWRMWLPGASLCELWLSSRMGGEKVGKTASARSWENLGILTLVYHNELYFDHGPLLPIYKLQINTNIPMALQ